ncbi:MAG TPA: AraC family transcriptional regulator [Acetobacteraceae bacterium]|nr:AraC family transcriptional regulator [Acetobacteraceae bacterium]
MNRTVPTHPSPRLERSCKPPRGDWIRHAPAQPGLDRMDAFFAGHAFDPHRHDTYAIGITLSGVQSFDYRGARADSTAGYAIVLYPDEMHDGRAGAAEGFHYRMLYLEPRLIRDALGQRARALPCTPHAVQRDPRLLVVLRLALDDLSRPLESLELDQAVLSLSEALLALDPSARGRSEVITCAIAVERARAFLDAHLSRTVASEELEAETGLDRYTLARQFRRRLGTSPYRYLVMRRLDRARARMRAGDSLAEAAFASGFADQSHMTRQFHRTYGITPGRWRELDVTR